MSPASQSFRFRESRRVLREVPVRLSGFGEGGELVARTRDIATGGMFVSTPEVRPVGTGASFVLELGSDDASDTVRGEATVVWVREASGGADQPAGMGMRFTSVDPPGEERLAMLFSEQPDEAAAPPAAAEAAPPAPAEAAGVEDEAPTPAPEDDAAPLEEAEPAEPVDRAQTAAVESEEGEVEEVTPEIETEAGAEAPLPDEAAAGEEVSGTRAELFGDLAGDDDDWMKPESDSPSWVWPTVVGVILVGVLLFFLRGPLMRLAGMGGAEEQPPAVAQSFDLPAPVEAEESPQLAAPPPASAGAPADSRLPVPPGGAVSSEESVAREADGPPESVAASPAPAGVAEPPPAEPSPVEPSQPEPSPARPAAETTARTEAARPPEPVAPPRAPSPSRPAPAAAAAPPANATALRSITASVRDGDTVVEIAGNAPFRRHHLMPLEAPPRLLVRLIGVQRAYDASAVAAPRLRGVRTAVHGRGATRNLHVVLDLAAPDMVATVERRGDRVVVNLSD